MCDLRRLIVDLWGRIWHCCFRFLDATLPLIDRNVEIESRKHESDIRKINEKLRITGTKLATVEFNIQASDQKSETTSQKLKISDNKLQAMGEKLDDIRILLDQVITYRKYSQSQHLTIPNDSISDFIGPNQNPLGVGSSVVGRDEASIRPPRISINRSPPKSPPKTPTIKIHRKPS